MLTRDQIDEWDFGVKPNLTRPFILCRPGEGTRKEAMDFDPGVRVIAVVRTRVEGEMLRKIGYEWVDLKKPKHLAPKRSIVTLHGAHKLYPFQQGDYLIATDWRMLGDRKTKVHKVFATSQNVKRLCVAGGPPHAWATWNVARCLGVASRQLRQINDYHASRHAVNLPNGFYYLLQPDAEARDDILNHFKQFVDERKPQ